MMAFLIKFGEKGDLLQRNESSIKDENLQVVEENFAGQQTPLFVVTMDHLCAGSLDLVAHGIVVLVLPLELFQDFMSLGQYALD